MYVCNSGYRTNIVCVCWLEFAFLNCFCCWYFSALVDDKKKNDSSSYFSSPSLPFTVFLLSFNVCEQSEELDFVTTIIFVIIRLRLLLLLLLLLSYELVVLDCDNALIISIRCWIIYYYLLLSIIIYYYLLLSIKYF